MSDYSGDLENLDNFNWYYKDFFKWKPKNYKKGKRIVYIGEKKDNPNYTVVFKKLNIENKFKEILKEIYFLSCCNKSKYFIKLVDIFFSDDKNYIFLILKDEGVNLSELIEYIENGENGFDYRNIPDMICWITFQIVCGLRILHANNLIHQDIKPGNIVISSKSVVKLCDFGSVDIIGTNAFGTISYESPSNLLGKNNNEKDDMWGVGVIMIELFKKSSPFFNWRTISNSEINKKRSQLKSILSHYRIRVNNNEININEDTQLNLITNQVIVNNNFDNFEEELLDIGIEDQDALDLIKNLLKIDPSKRFSAEQALHSNYLSKYINNFDPESINEITHKTTDYNRFCNIVNNKNDFVKNVELIKQKFIGEVIFE
mgnify:CR=1 FL=1